MSIAVKMVDIIKTFPGITANDKINFDVRRGEVHGLLGENGAGKTVLMNILYGMYRLDDGLIFVNGKEAKIDSSAAAIKLGIGMVHQHFMLVASLTVAENIVLGREPTKHRWLLDVGRIEDQIKALSDRYKLGVDPKTVACDLPVGLQQRVEILKALFRGAEVLILDEPTSSVDVSVRAQLLNMFQDLQRDLGLTYMFISHDLSVVECISHRVAVMYLGKIVEQAKTEEIYKNPMHPYAQALFNSIPIPDPTRRRERAPLLGEPPSPVNPPSGCRFHPRCSLATNTCEHEEPPLIDVGNEHYVACFALSK